MSIRASILNRLIMAGRTTFGRRWMRCRTPSIRMRTTVSLGLEVDVAGALLEGIVQQVPDRANNGLVVGIEVTAFLGAHTGAPRFPRSGKSEAKVLLCSAHGASKTMKLDDDAEDLRLRRDDDDDLLVLDPRNALHEFVVPRVRHRNGQRRIRIVDGHDQVPLGKGSAESARDELVVELKRVEVHKWQAPRPPRPPGSPPPRPGARSGCLRD